EAEARVVPDRRSTVAAAGGVEDRDEMRPRAQSSHGRGFGAQAEVYDEVRPGYPAAALDLAGSDWQGMRVCDLGAGTGILSRELLARGCEVLAVGPDPAALARNQAPKRIGTAEDTGSVPACEQAPRDRDQ